MMPIPVESPAPIPQPAYHRAQARSKVALHIDALTLVHCLHLLAICRLAVRLAYRRCPPLSPAGPERCSTDRTYSEASLLLIALLRTLCRLSYQDIARLAQGLARFSSHMWIATEPAGMPAHSQPLLTVQTPSCRRSPSL